MKCLAHWDDLKRLFSLMRNEGQTLFGPRLKDGAVMIDEISSPDDLPVGWTDTQEPGSYRLQRHPEDLVFGFHAGPDSWKRLLLPPQSTVWEAECTSSGFEVLPSRNTPRAMGFIGMHGCDVAAMLRLDHVFGFRSDPGPSFHTLPSSCIDPEYADRRRNAFIIGVQCIQPGGNCFCSSLGAGPQIHAGCDLVFTELPGTGEPRFLLESLSFAGQRVLGELSLGEAGQEDAARAKHLLEECAAAMTKSLDLSGIREMIEQKWDHPRWQATAERCLTCGNCTMVCPTCFCTDILDETDLAGRKAQRVRLWDSCFSLEYSYVHGGGNVRTSAASRYRQWMVHKLATWVDQFGETGCVGCGRCITWCPAAIDITEEAAVIRESDGVHAPSTEDKCHVRS